MNNKKTRIAIISVVALLLLLIGVTYAYWLVTKTQTNSNIISSACLDITLDNESAAINLGSQYPMSDEDGMKLTPYTFKVTNNCNTSVDYQVVLESIGSEESSIKASALQVALDTNAGLLSNRASVSSTVSGAYAAHRLGYGTLAARGSEGSSATHSVRIWIDENAPISEANKTYQSKISVTIGQGIKNPYVEGTIAYDILANNDAPTTINSNLKEVVSSSSSHGIDSHMEIWYGTEYILDEETGLFSLSGNVVQSTIEDCRSGINNCLGYTLFSENQYESSEHLYKVTSLTSSEEEDTDYELYMTTQSITTKNYFSEAKTVEAGLYKTIDDLGESYYYRGNVTNNYVQFGAFEKGTHMGSIEKTTYSFSFHDEEGVTWDYHDWSEPLNSLEECENTAKNYLLDGQVPQCYVYQSETEDYILTEDMPMYWRIVRINGGGTIRLVYDGITKVENGAKHSATIFSSSYAEDYYNAYAVGYTYNKSANDKTQIDSTAKKLLDEWYNKNLKTNYGGYIADGIFCNDREKTKLYYVDEYGELVANPNDATIINYDFAPTSRLSRNPKPQLTCTKKEDRYSVGANIGNGLLEQPIGMLTADEACFAGACPSNKNHYLYSGEDFWTISPAYADDREGLISSYVVSNGLGTQMIGDASNIRPVINLRTDVEFTGDGSFETPYVIVTE